MTDPENNRNSSLMRDPPGLIRALLRWRVDKVIDPKKREQRRQKAEAKRMRSGEPHIVEYFHQLDDPYSHLAAQTLERLAERYEIELKTHLIPATGGSAQPELEKLEVWARKDAELIAPHYGLSFDPKAPVLPDADVQRRAADYLSQLAPADRISELAKISSAVWDGDAEVIPLAGGAQARSGAALEAGAARLKALRHYSGAMFYYGGEWYWGIDRLFYLEQRLRDLGVAKGEAARAGADFIAPRPAIDVSSIDASNLRLDFYPSINSPYTAIIYDKVIEVKDACGIEFHHKPVLPMVMRGVPAPVPKVEYIVFDTKRESEFLGVQFGPMLTPLGNPTRRTYALFSWAAAQGKDEALMSSLLKCAFANGVGIHTQKGMRQGIEAAGLDWTEAKKRLDSDDWKPLIAEHQDEMIDGLGLWGVPSMRLSGPDGEPDVAVWGQDRLWLIAAEIRRRGQCTG
ncbi:MAG: DsbA family protein [Pseudomonadota bacterium]